MNSDELDCEVILGSDNVLTVVEVTLNLSDKVLKGKTQEYRHRYLKQAFEAVAKEYNAVQQDSTIEYCQSGLPHLHGYMVFPLKKELSLADHLVLPMLARSYFLQLPRSVYKQMGSADIQTKIRRFSTPAVHLNLKEHVCQEWLDYMHKFTASVN